MPAKSKSKSLPALAHLKGVLMVLDNRTKRPTAELLVTIREMVGEPRDRRRYRQPRRFSDVAVAAKRTLKSHPRRSEGWRTVRVVVPGTLPRCYPGGSKIPAHRPP